MPNAGFYEDAVFPDPSSLPSTASQPSDGDTSADKKSDDEEEIDPDAANIVCSEQGPASSSQLDDKNDVSEQVASELDGLKVVEDNEVHTENQQSLSTEDVDLLLERCLMQALHTTVKDKDLPMPGSTLW